MIWSIALPIMGGMMSQNVLNLVDIGMVGRLGTARWLPPESAGLPTTWRSRSSSACPPAFRHCAATAWAKAGIGNRHTLNGGLLLALMIGLPLCIILILATPYAYTFLSADPEVRELGIPYLQVRIASMIAVGMNFSFRGYWSAIHMTGIYLKTLLIMHAINIFLNWVLIFGNLGAPELGVYGAGLATTISLYIGTALYFFFAIGKASDKGFLHRIPSRDTLVEAIQAVPAQQPPATVFFSAVWSR